MVKQRHNSDCGIAAVANACGVPYKKVKERFGRIDRGGILYHELVWILSEFGDFKEIRVRRPVTLEHWLTRHKEGTFVLVLHKFLDDFHAVAVVNGEVMGHCSPQWTVGNSFRLQTSEQC